MNDTSTPAFDPYLTSIIANRDTRRHDTPPAF